MTYKITRENVHINNSYLISKHDVFDALQFLIEENPDSAVFMSRHIAGMVHEWVVHNALYRLNIRREQTRDVDLNYPRKWWEPVAYFVLFPFAWAIAD